MVALADRCKSARTEVRTKVEVQSRKTGLCVIMLWTELYLNATEGHKCTRELTWIFLQ